MRTLIVFSHLRWDFVYQRPQHLLTRIAQRWNVLFVEEPILEPGRARIEVETPCAGVRVLRPVTPIKTPGFHDDQFPTIRALLDNYLTSNDINDYGVWIYTPMALPLLVGLEPETLVYDCMDQLSAFKGAPPQLIAREAALLTMANVVFTGGPALYDAKRHTNPNVHCMPSSVDVEHFRQGRDPAIADRRFAETPRPRLGFFGVIDERFDVELVAGLADARPDWQIVLVGPVIKIDPDTLPQRDNLHYVPQVPYTVLPKLLAAWDLCLLLFARNESTRYISPTKTLEYMAAEKPVVSTPITDIVRLYSDGVHLAEGVDKFVLACEAALDEDPRQREARIARQRALVEATSWDRTAASIASLIERSIAGGLRSAAREFLARSPGLGRRSPTRISARESIECLILGGGPTGLSTAYHYGKGSVLVERNEQVGGWCRSLDDAGFCFDHAGHIMFSRDPYVLSLYETLLGDNVHWQDREAWIYSKGVHTRYPFQGALYGLPADVLKECIVGAIEARFGSLTDNPMAPATAPLACSIARDAKAPEDCCADGVTASDISRTRLGDVKDDAGGTITDLANKRGPRNFEEFINNVWGRGVAKHFAVPYNRKLWTVPLDEMETSWLGGRVPMPDLEEMIEGALQPVAKPMGPNARFGYPLRGGFQALMNGFLPLLEGDLLLGRAVCGVSPGKRSVTLEDGRVLRYRHLVSTVPLPELIKMIGDEAPADIRRAAQALRHVSVRCVNLGIGRENITDKHWIYYPEQTVFHRIFVQGNASPHNNPPGGFGLTCEISYSPSKPLPAEGEALIQRCIADCIAVGILREDDVILTGNEVDMPYAYVIYDHARAVNVARIRGWLAERDIVLAGRYSEWEYYNSDHAFVAGKRAAEQLRSEQRPAQARVT